MQVAAHVLLGFLAVWHMVEDQIRWNVYLLQVHMWSLLANGDWARIGVLPWSSEGDRPCQRGSRTHNKPPQFWTRMLQPPCSGDGILLPDGKQAFAGRYTRYPHICMSTHLRSGSFRCVKCDVRQELLPQACTEFSARALEIQHQFASDCAGWVYFLFLRNPECHTLALGFYIHALYSASYRLKAWFTRYMLSWIMHTFTLIVFVCVSKNEYTLGVGKKYGIQKLFSVMYCLINSCHYPTQKQ